MLRLIQTSIKHTTLVRAQGRKVDNVLLVYLKLMSIAAEVNVGNPTIIFKLVRRCLPLV